jgi:hypothetical protein
LFCLPIGLAISLFTINPYAQSEDYLTWTATQAENIGKQMRDKKLLGNRFFDTRGLDQNKAINYKLRATLMSPEMIRATARLEQIRNRLTDAETRKLVAEADAAGDLIVMIELYPNEGSGVIPLDWRCFLQPKGSANADDGVVAGVKSPQFRNIKALQGIFRRDYDYDVFWVAFPLLDNNKKPTIPTDNREIEVVVGINSKEGRISWRVPDSVVSKIVSLQRK